MSHTVGIYTLGCKVNQYESEAIAEAFSAEGFSVRPPHQVCDVYVINTCTVTAESDRKAGQFIRRMIKKNPAAFVLVTGCLGQTDPARVARIDGVDYVCGNTDKLSVVEAAKALLAGGVKGAVPRVSVSPLEDAPFEEMVITRFDRTRAYVKIEDGCESRCAYCIIPRARGPIRSKAPTAVIAEVEGLVAGGCREVVLTGIETASYGKDLEGSYGLADLLCEVDRIDGIGRVRLGSLDPSLMTPSFVEKIAPFLPEKDIAADIYITHTRRVLLVDLNSWGGNTDAKMLKWEQLQETQKPLYGIVPPPRKISGQLEVKF